MYNVDAHAAAAADARCGHPFRVGAPVFKVFEPATDVDQTYIKKV